VDDLHPEHGEQRNGDDTGHTHHHVVAATNAVPSAVAFPVMSPPYAGSPGRD